ncbi:MAG TPA: TRAP transporter large permease subunit [Spirochaetota bacterium]|nr:TRAP transporter large permease subunit [Spirochaetota bacterium]HPR49774.1 TRAP transporter large permease subunit [Spirochaetota bacterium]
MIFNHLFFKEKFNIAKAALLAHFFENSLSFFILFFLALLPVIEIVARAVFKTGVPSSTEYIQHLVLWITFVGGMITSREERHLALSIGIDSLKGKTKDIVRFITAFIACSVIISIAWSSLSMVFVGFDESRNIGIFPIRFIAMIMPIGYAIIAARFVIPLKQKQLRILAASGLIIGSFFSIQSIVNILMSFDVMIPSVIDTINSFIQLFLSNIALFIVAILILSAFFGMPIFVVLGGIAYFLFIRSGGSVEVISNEAYAMLISHSIPAIPLFTFAGFILSESKAGERLVNLFKAWFGWLPGGMSIMAVLVCTFFTTFTGASGVTILALGGLLSFILIESVGYPKNFTNGLLTASGSIGLLFPPSLPIILYGVVAQISIKDMFLGGIIPGIIMVLVLSLYGVSIAYKKNVQRIPFKLHEAIGSIKESIWELLLPFIIFLGYFGGLTTIVETGGVAVLYSLIITTVIHRDIPLKRLPQVMQKCMPIIGGVLIILALSRGLSYYIVDAEIPMSLSYWVRDHIHSRILFLVLLNIALLITGCLMDIFSAIMVVVPLIIPLGEIFGIHPVHLGIIFLANLELGYLTPPVGLNLFLASYRFDEKLSKIYMNVVPFFFVLLVAVILITYIPWFSTGLLQFFQ